MDMNKEQVTLDQFNELTGRFLALEATVMELVRRTEKQTEIIEFLSREMSCLSSHEDTRKGLEYLLCWLGKR